MELIVEIFVLSLLFLALIVVLLIHKYKLENLCFNFKSWQTIVGYYLLILDMRTEIIDHVKETLDEVVYDAENTRMIYIVVFLIIAFCCVALIVV